jgi:hypothetical protein
MCAHRPRQLIGSAYRPGSLCTPGEIDAVLSRRPDLAAEMERIARLPPEMLPAPPPGAAERRRGRALGGEPRTAWATAS